VVLITIAGLLAIAIWRSRPALRWWGLLPVVGVFAQAVLGAVSVHVKLNPLVIGAHMMISVALVWASMWLLLRYCGAPRRTAGPSLNLARRASLALFAAVVVLGTITTGSGPHSGDPAATERLGIDPAHAAKAHALVVWVFVVVVAYLAIVLWRRRADAVDADAGADGARRAIAWLAAVTLAQGAIGYTQYALGLPILVVELHLIGIAALAAAHSAAFYVTRRA
jgi:cytochrome c oxidase assembly protein subunit 15